MIQQFHDRSEAGHLLAQKLQPHYATEPNLLVLGLPRGGVPIAYEVAQLLDAPLDICIVRKLGVPGDKELAMGAISSHGIMILDEELVDELKISQNAVKQVILTEQQELERRERVYRGSRPFPDLANRTIILVDDGIATGSTLKAALSTIQAQKPKQIVVAVPIAPPDICSELKEQVDELVCLFSSLLSVWKNPCHF